MEGPVDIPIIGLIEGISSCCNDLLLLELPIRLNWLTVHVLVLRDVPFWNVARGALMIGIVDWRVPIWMWRVMFYNHSLFNNHLSDLFNGWLLIVFECLFLFVVPSDHTTTEYHAYDHYYE